MLIINSSYYSSSEIDVPNQSKPLLVTSAGRHVLNTLSLFDTVRPLGRKDYQILYVKKGCLHYTLDKTERIAHEGSIVIYRPLAPQYYSYYLDEAPDIYWVHFTGNAVEQLLEKAQLKKKMCFTVGSDERYEQIFNEIIFELKKQSLNFTEICSAMLTELVYLFSRNFVITEKSSESTPNEINDIVHLFNTAYSDEYNIDELAHRYNMSVSWLTRLFNRYFHMSPQKYLMYVRIEKAKTMLRSTNSISDIATVIGYSDPLYFSRVFRKLTGLSPSEYRKRNSEIAPISIEEAPWNKK